MLLLLMVMLLLLLMVMMLLFWKRKMMMGPLCFHSCVPFFPARVLVMCHLKTLFSQFFINKHWTTCTRMMKRPWRARMRLNLVKERGGLTRATTAKQKRSKPAARNGRRKSSCWRRPGCG